MGNTTKQILIPFSGGLDSTYLVSQILSETNDNVILINFKLNNNPSQIELENEARETIYEWFIKKYGEIRIYWIKDAADFGVSNGTKHYSLEIAQPLFWATALSMFTKNIDEVHMGYVIGDCAISWLPEIQSLFKTALKFSHSSNIPELKFPMHKNNKLDIWKELPSDLKYKISVCEGRSENSLQCGVCSSCKSFIYRAGEDAFNYYLINKGKDIIVEKSERKFNKRRSIKPFVKRFKTKFK